MRLFYDKNGKRISRKAIREIMDSKNIYVGDKVDKKIKKDILSTMSEEEFSDLNQMKYKDFRRKGGKK